jgi:menaquinol-cytochrome c reductase iron-sulfur subunit
MPCGFPPLTHHPPYPNKNMAANSCCCAKRDEPGDANRRGFLAQALAVLCGGFALLIPAAAGALAFLNPLRQKSTSGQFMRLAALDVLPSDGTPQKVPVVADRIDGWNRYPLEPIGAVFLSHKNGKVSALQVVCPHAGCSINYESASGGKFFCPCHAASFDLAGKRTDATSPSPRDMDSLEVEIRNKNEVWVKFQTFALGKSAKVAQG